MKKGCPSRMREEAHLVYMGKGYNIYWVERMEDSVNGIVYNFWRGWIKNTDPPQMVANKYGQPVFSMADGKYYYPCKKWKRR